MNKILKISLSLLLFPIITLCSDNVVFFSKGKGKFQAFSHENKSTEKQSSTDKKIIDEERLDSSSASSTIAAQSTETLSITIKKIVDTQSSDSSKALSSLTTQSTITTPAIGFSYDLPILITQDKEFIPGMSFGCDNKGIRESAANFIHRLINARKLLDACSKPDKLQSKEPKINERITEALREINLKFNDEQKKAHVAVSKLLTEQKTNFTQSTNSMLSILLTLKSIGISQIISGQDVEIYNQNIETEINLLKEESKLFHDEKVAQIAHLETIQNRLNEHLQSKLEKKESK